MSLGGKDIKKYRLIRLWLLALNVAVILAYGAIVFFTDWKILEYEGLKVALGFALFYILYHFVSNFFIEKKPDYIFELSFFVMSFYIILIVDYFGGPTGNVALLLFIIILGSYLYRTLWGVATMTSFAIYALIYGFLLAENFFDEWPKYLIFFSSVGFSSLVGFTINRRNQLIFKESQNLKKVAEKLTSEKSQDEAVLTSIADGVYAVDKNRNVVLLNKAAQEMTGWAERDALGIKCKTVMNLMTGDQNLSVCEKDCPALAVWNTGEPVFRNDTCFVHRKNKKRIQLSSSYAPIKNMEGEMVGSICVFRDITREKELERQRNEFVSTASHELRTPITATEGYLSIITDSGMCKIDTKGVEYLDKAKKTLMGMSTLIKNLLSVTKIEEGKLETTITNFPIRDLAGEVVEVFSQKATDKGIKLELIESQELATGAGKRAIGRTLNVRADREMIREVLSNLIENSVKFTNKGQVTVSIDYDEEFATVNVADTGIGMPKEAEKHLFEKFYRIDNTATREVGGTGLGLYITRSIVETFGGRIWAESSLGKGSTFHFTIPLALDA